MSGGGIAGWSIRHPVGVVMIALAVLVLGTFALGKLSVDLLPHIIYPEVRVRILDNGVPGQIMEDQITRQLEEQLAITEDAIAVQSTSSEGRSSVDLTFPYGKDIDIALRDASTRLDRAKRFLPSTIDPPVIYKRDPSQIPALEFVVSSRLRDPVELRSWLDYEFSRWFVNLPGVASTEVGGGPLREIQVLPDQRRLAGYGLTVADIVNALDAANRDVPGGALRMEGQEIGSRTSGRLGSVEAISQLTLRRAEDNGSSPTIRLSDVAQVLDSAEDERLRIRLNSVPGLKLAIQKQPQANTVAVVDAVNSQLEFLAKQALIPNDIHIDVVEDQSIYIRQSLNNATIAAASGAVLAMLVVYLFLGDVRRTLIIGSGIPLAIMVAVVIMALSGLTLNIMTLGGLALGVGMLVDNTIVMLENIYRHQRAGNSDDNDAIKAAAEVHGAVIASTSTNLAAILPFLFIGGLVGLLFRELIATISAAIVASLLIALTLVPALSARVPSGARGPLGRLIDTIVQRLADAYAWGLRPLLKAALLVVPAFALAGTLYAWPKFQSENNELMPTMDDGRIVVSFLADPGISLDAMDALMNRIEDLILEQPETLTAFAEIGGFVFGRSQYEATNRGRIKVQLVSLSQRTVSSKDWIERMKKEVSALQIPGARIRFRTQGIRGLRLTRSDDDVSIRIRGNDLTTLSHIGEDVVSRIENIEGLDNARHSYEDHSQELSVSVDRDRAAALGLDITLVGNAVRTALNGIVATDFLDGDRRFDVRVRLPRHEMSSPRDLEQLLLSPANNAMPAVHLGDVARVELKSSPANIVRDRQQRIVEVSANIKPGYTLGAVNQAINTALSDLELPPGYTRYDGGAADALAKSESLFIWLLALAVFLVLVVMAVQYESLKNPLIILLSVPFAAVGVAIAIDTLQMPISMPVWLGLIMLAGIVVNNAIVFVEYVEIGRRQGLDRDSALIEAARLRLRPILMTTLTTVVGMAPLAIGLGEGSELLQPLAITIVYGLAFSTLVSLILVPCLYRLSTRQGVSVYAEAVLT